MAGGIGSRLKPFTTFYNRRTNKDKPIIEHIIDSFVKAGSNQFYITVNYKAKILKAYFDELNPNYNVEFVKENQPLGTAGSLSLIEESLFKYFFVTNCDIIVKDDYKNILDFT